MCTAVLSAIADGSPWTPSVEPARVGHETRSPSVPWLTDRVRARLLLHTREKKEQPITLPEWTAVTESGKDGKADTAHGTIGDPGVGTASITNGAVSAPLLPRHRSVKLHRNSRRSFLLISSTNGYSGSPSANDADGPARHVRPSHGPYPCRAHGGGRVRDSLLACQH